MAIYPREDARTALPQLEKKFTTMADEFNKKMDGMLDFFYPVGCYFETSDTDFDPNTKWGGTWELEVAGQVHVSAGTGYSVSGADTNTTDGGASTVALEIANMPSHNHGEKSLTGTITLRGFYTGSSVLGRSGIVSGNTNRASSSYSPDSKNEKKMEDYITLNATHTHNSQGSGTAHNNMQPYIVVNRWHRVN